jgi:hypothetical protein
MPLGRVLAHRGLHSSAREENSPEAISAALEAGFGVETDVRSYLGDLVIAHDPPRGSCPALKPLWERIGHRASDAGSLLALNVKEDGLVGQLLSLLTPEHFVDEPASQPHAGLFFFDMSVPQLVLFARVGLPVAGRVSEYEPVSSLAAMRAISYRYLWIDAFHEDWFVGNKELESWCESRTGVVVSPEIHGRDPRHAWDWIYEASTRGISLGICTDKPVDFMAWGN